MDGELRHCAAQPRAGAGSHWLRLILLGLPRQHADSTCLADLRLQPASHPCPTPANTVGMSILEHPRASWTIIERLLSAGATAHLPSPVSCQCPAIPA